MKKKFADGGNVVTSASPANAFASPQAGLGALPQNSAAQPPTSPYPAPAGPFTQRPAAFKKGGAVKTFKKGGSVHRGDGCATKGRTKGKFL